VWSAALFSLILGCSRDESSTPSPPGASPKEIALPGAAVFIGAGDIGVCGTSGDEATAHIVDSVLAAAPKNSPSAVFTLGDNAYPSGKGGVDNDFPRCFAPSWGSARIMNAIHPAPGNHDYDSGSGAPYFTYFGGLAGPPLNSELYFGPGADPVAARAQENWLRRDLADHRVPCSLAYFHRPLFTSGVGSPTQQMHGLWQILYDGGADVILNGHHHHYERFLPQTPEGVADTAKGIEEIIAGTGGGELRGVKRSLARNSVTEIHGHFGVLKLVLGAGEYSHAFIDTNGRAWDPARGKCH